MCSNYQPIQRTQSTWVKQHFECDLPIADWRDDVYPSYPSPFIYLDNGKPKCELAKFGLIPHWAIGKKNFGNSKYNARSETVASLPTFRSAWKERRFGLALMQSFYEPNWETNKAIRWRIKRADLQPIAVASLWERVIDTETGEVIFSFSMLTINADAHEVMKHFHKQHDEKRSIVVLDDSEYMPWLHANHEKAKALLQLAPSEFLISEPAPLFRQPRAVNSNSIG